MPCRRSACAGEQAPLRPGPHPQQAPGARRAVRSHRRSGGRPVVPRTASRSRSWALSAMSCAVPNVLRRNGLVGYSLSALPQQRGTRSSHPCIYGYTPHLRQEACCGGPHKSSGHTSRRATSPANVRRTARRLFVCERPVLLSSQLEPVLCGSPGIRKCSGASAGRRWLPGRVQTTRGMASRHGRHTDQPNARTPSCRCR